MAGITNGRPDLAVGEPIRLGDNFEIEQHPVSDRLIIRDTENGKVAYVRAERGGEVGGDGVLIKALKEGKPMADDGRTYNTIQQAERKASSWVFVPPGEYEESVEINTKGMTLQGCGYNTHINGYINVKNNNITIKNLSASYDNDVVIYSSNNKYTTVKNVTVRDNIDRAFNFDGNYDKMINCHAMPNNADSISVVFNSENGICIGNYIEDSNERAMTVNNENIIIANNIIKNSGGDSISDFSSFDNSIITSNRIINSGGNGIDTSGENNIISNNRVSGSTDTDIIDSGTNTLLHENLTGE